METFYLIDFENVHNEGLGNIVALKPTDHVHIFSTENAMSIRLDIAFVKNVDVNVHIVPVCKQSLDMHLVSYLGYLLGIHGKQCSYIIISKDKDYDNIIKFWEKEGWTNISRKTKVLETAEKQKKTTPSSSSAQITINKTDTKVPLIFSGNDRSALNVFMQRGLVAMGYPSSNANKICKCIVAHCNDTQMLIKVHNELRKEFDDYSKVYIDVKDILGKFVPPTNKTTKKETELHSLFNQNLKQKIYMDHKEELIKIILNAKTKQILNNGLTKLYTDGNVLRHIYQVIQPFIKDLPGK